MMLELSGIAAMRSGVVGEEWTADELRRLRRHGWLVVNHMMLVHVDVDHVVFGPGGLLAVETKFRSDWGRGKQELGTIAGAAQRAARDVASRVRRRERDVLPLVVVWGPDARTHFPGVTVHAGVTFCPGHLLRRYVLALPAKLSNDEVAAAFGHLDSYLEKRDERESSDLGPLPRTIGDATTDAFAAATGCLASILAVVAPVSYAPKGLWSVVAGAAIAVGATVARHRWRDNMRFRRVTGVVIGTCTLLVAALLLVMTSSLLF